MSKSLRARVVKAAILGSLSAGLLLALVGCGAAAGGRSSPTDGAEPVVTTVAPIRSSPQV
jgi:hypothetical protein